MKSHPISPGLPIFIISPTKRAGTNCLKNLVCWHEDCSSPGPVWEDELLRKVHLLAEFIDFTFDKWNSNWQVKQELLSRQQAMGHLGSALIDILHSQFVKSEDKKERFSRSLDQQQNTLTGMLRRHQRQTILPLFSSSSQTHIYSSWSGMAVQLQNPRTVLLQNPSI